MARRDAPGVPLRSLIPCLLAALLLGCGDASPSGDGGDSTALATVHYAGSNWYGHAPVWVGIKHGIFEKAGFHVVDKSFGGSSERVNALEGNQAQFSSLGEVAMLMAMADERRNFYWIGSQNNAPGNEGLVAVGVSSVAGLKGKTIALSARSSVHVTVAALLEQAGLDIATDVTITHADNENVITLVAEGDAAAGAIWEPYYSQLRALPDAVVLGTDRDTTIYQQFQTMTGPDVICASKTWVDEDPDRARRFFRAYFEAVAWCEAHPAALLEIVAERVAGSTSREAVETALKNFTWLDFEAQRLTMSEARLLGQAPVAAATLQKIGLVETVPEPALWTWPALYQ